MPRLFVGLELPAPVRQVLLQVRGEVPGARWQTADQLHLTLCFIGQIEAASMPAIITCLQSIRQSPFELALQGVGCFGRAEKPRALWAGVEPESPLHLLHQLIRRGLAPAVPLPKAQPYRPHITLARFRAQAGPCWRFLDEHARLSSASFKVTEFCLFSSTATVDGSRYQVEARFPLNH